MDLKAIARQVRIDILEMIGEAGSGHIGGSFSAVETMIALYFSVLRNQDKVIFSKGHASALLYACLAESGHIPWPELKTFRKLGSRLQGHPAPGLPGVEIATGSLGQGLSVGVGLALGLRIAETANDGGLYPDDRRSPGSQPHRGLNGRVYVLIGDGECQCGQIWEAAMAAAHYRLNNLCAILDYNRLQIDGPNSAVMNLAPIRGKWRAFGWHVIEVDGHDFDQLIRAYENADIIDDPTVIIANTTKGKGVSFMENDPAWHGKVPRNELLEKAREELNV